MSELNIKVNEQYQLLLKNTKTHKKTVRPILYYYNS